jgi:Na+/H+ antiporter NhaD/arsenite permease-like protein
MGFDRRERQRVRSVGMEHAGFVPSLPWILPFACLLLGIAVIPLAAPSFWDSNLRKLAVSLVLGVPVLALYAVNAPHAMVHTASDYASFMILLGSLYVISGGVLMDGDLEATPLMNTAFLAVGAVLASIVGTTGASMLMIRPLLHTNKERAYTVHTFVFFIFIVSNVGGSLTPLGDPPLFLGYLQGVPFTWTLRLLPIWLFTCGLLLAVYFTWDTVAHRRESASSLTLDRSRLRPLHIRGLHNLGLLLGIVAAAAFLDAPWRELAMIGVVGASWLSTSHHIRHAHHFSFHPILEVAAVFAGIFLTMVPALDILRAHGTALGVNQPWHFFWATGALSSFLDNAPTYLTFLALGQGLHLPPEVVGVPHHLLEAISAGAVFMGANSYIGNGPNFMVRSIAEARGVRMPSFGGYLLYSGAILIPVFVIVTLVFFR